MLHTKVAAVHAGRHPYLHLRIFVATLPTGQLRRIEVRRIVLRSWGQQIGACTGRQV